MLEHRDLIIKLAAQHRLPAVNTTRYFVAEGGLMSYGPDRIDLYRRAAGFNTIFISKIFSQKIWPKNWSGSSNRKFRERHVCGSGSCSTPPPVRADEKYRRRVLPEGRISRRGIRRARQITGSVDRRLVTSFMPGVCHILATFHVPCRHMTRSQALRHGRQGAIWRSAEWALLASGSDPASSCSRPDGAL